MAIQDRTGPEVTTGLSASTVALVGVVGVCTALLFAIPIYPAVEGHDEALWPVAAQAFVVMALLLTSSTLSNTLPRARVARLLGFTVSAVTCVALLGVPTMTEAMQVLSASTVVVVFALLVSSRSVGWRAPRSSEWESGRDKDASRTEQEYTGSLKALHAASVIRDGDIRDHGQAVARLAARLGSRLGMPPRETESLYWAALLHDVGKVGVERSILRKPGRLTADEYVDVMRHSNIGADLIRSIGPDVQYHAIAQMVLHHHERWDGRGYPSGRRAADIPIGARIIAITDAYEALLSDRAYRPAICRDEALRVIVEGAGAHFDPDLVSVFVAMVTDIDTAEQERSRQGASTDKAVAKYASVESNRGATSLLPVNTASLG